MSQPLLLVLLVIWTLSEYFNNIVLFLSIIFLKKYNVSMCMCMCMCMFMSTNSDIKDKLSYIDCLAGTT